MVGIPTARAASAKRTTPYMPSWSVTASASSPRRVASSTSSSGWDAPSRKLKLEWQWSSAYGTTLCRRRPALRSAGGRYGARLYDQAGLSPPSPSDGKGRVRVRPDSAPSKSFHGTGGFW